MSEHKHMPGTARIVARLSGRVSDYQKQGIPIERISLHPDCTYLIMKGKTYLAKRYYVGQPFIDDGPPTESDGYPGDEWTECQEIQPKEERHDRS